MLLFDTHAHLDDERLRDDLPAVLDRAAAAGVAHVLCVATTAADSPAVAGGAAAAGGARVFGAAPPAADSPRCLQTAARSPTVWAGVGIQPTPVAGAGPGDWDGVVRLAPSPRVVPLGEPGLDRH